MESNVEHNWEYRVAAELMGGYCRFRGGYGPASARAMREAALFVFTYESELIWG